MDKLPLEIWERIVEWAIWAPRPFVPELEGWEDGPSQLELAGFHPLRSYLDYEGSSWPPKWQPTEAEKVLCTLMGTSKELKIICERFTRELLSAHVTVAYRCGCALQGAHHECAYLQPLGGFSIDRGTATGYTKVLNVADVKAQDLEELYFGDWPIISPVDFEPLRQCSNLAALSLHGQTLPWLSLILDALPGGGARLKQLRLAYPDRLEHPSDAVLEGILAAMNHCTSLDVLDLNHAWKSERPASSKALVLALTVLLVLPRLLALRITSLGGDEEPHRLRGRTAAQIVRQPLQLVITRLDFTDTEIEQDIIERVTQSCSGTLEYLNLERNAYFSTFEVAGSPANVAFPRLRYVAIEGWSVQYDEETPDLGAAILPAHWRLPAVEHLEAEDVDVAGQDNIDTFTERLLSWTKLRYLCIKGIWGDEGWTDQEEEQEEDIRYRWPARLQTDLRAKGVDATLMLRLA